MIIVSGGALAEGAEKALREHFMSTGEMRHQAAVMEAYSTEGDVDSPANVKVTVERFGSERTTDSMFENYIANCDKRVQRAFRIPSIFLGESADFNFATALSAMMVAEAQVFACERREFDEIINLKLMPELPHGDEFTYRSKGLGLRDATQQLEALGLVKDSITDEDFVSKVGETVGLELVFDEESANSAKDRDVEDRANEMLTRRDNANQRVADLENVGGKERDDLDDEPGGKKKHEHLTGVVSLAMLAADQLSMGLARPKDLKAWAEIERKVESLNPVQRKEYRELLTAALIPAFEHDPSGAAELVDSVVSVNATAAKA